GSAGCCMFCGVRPPEVEQLTAEGATRGWQPIETAPKILTLQDIQRRLGIGTAQAMRVQAALRRDEPDERLPYYMAEVAKERERAEQAEARARELEGVLQALEVIVDIAGYVRGVRLRGRYRTPAEQQAAWREWRAKLATLTPKG